MTDVRTLSIEELRERLQAGNNLQFWNVQTHNWFGGEIIPGSRRMPLDTIEHDTIGVSMDAEIITYSGSAECPQSVQAARRLAEIGYTNVRVYADGLDGWKSAGYETDRPLPPAA